MGDKQACKVFCGGLSWETSSERLRAYFENFGVVREAFVSYNRNNGRPRGFGFVVFESPEVADKVVATKHTVDRREVECKKAVPKEEQPANSSPPSSTGDSSSAARTRKVFVGGLAPTVDDKALRSHFEQFGTVEDAVVMYDHDNKRPRGFGFVTFASEESVDKVFGRGVMQTIADKQIEIKPAVPRDQMASTHPGPGAGGGGRGGSGPHFYEGHRSAYGGRPGAYGPPGGDYGMHGHHHPYANGANGPYRGYSPRGGYGGPAGMGGAGRGPRASNGPGGNFMGAAGFGSNGLGGRGGGYGSYGKHSTGMGGAGYPAPDLSYASGLPNGAAGMGGFNAQAALYNLAGFQPHLNGVQGPAAAAAAAAKLNAFNPNNINLKALGALASTFGGFPASQGDAGFQTDPAAAAAYAAGQEAAELAAAEAAAANLSAAAAAAGNHLSVPGDFNNFANVAREAGGFTASPAPGWSS